jgi:hypothetical protein
MAIQPVFRYGTVKWKKIRGEAISGRHMGHIYIGVGVAIFLAPSILVVLYLTWRTRKRTPG